MGRLVVVGALAQEMAWLVDKAFVVIVLLPHMILEQLDKTQAKARVVITAAQLFPISRIDPLCVEKSLL